MPEHRTGPARPDPGPDVDLALVRDDDLLLDELGAGAPGSARLRPGALDPVLALLVAWRDEIDDHPAPVGPTLDDAVVALSARRAPRLAHRVLAPLAAASVVGLALLGLGLAAHGSTPGDPLWGVSQTLFVDHSRSVQAAAAVDADLAHADVALNSGSREQAGDALDQARRELELVAPEQGRAELQQRHEELAALFDATPGPPTGAAPSPAVPPTTSPVPGATGGVDQGPDAGRDGAANGGGGQAGVPAPTARNPVGTTAASAPTPAPPATPADPTPTTEAPPSTTVRPSPTVPDPTTSAPDPTTDPDPTTPTSSPTEPIAATSVEQTPTDG